MFLSQAFNTHIVHACNWKIATTMRTITNDFSTEKQNETKKKSEIKLQVYKFGSNDIGQCQREREREKIYLVCVAKQHTTTSPNVYDASTCASYVSILQRTRIKLFFLHETTNDTHIYTSTDKFWRLNITTQSAPLSYTIGAAAAAAAMVTAAVLFAAHWICSKRCFSFTISILCVLAAKRHKLYVSQYMRPSHQYADKSIRWIHSSTITE